jgi:hypothetical protein
LAFTSGFLDLIKRKPSGTPDPKTSPSRA